MQNAVRQVVVCTDSNTAAILGRVAGDRAAGHFHVCANAQAHTAAAGAMTLRHVCIADILFDHAAREIHFGVLTEHAYACAVIRSVPMDNAVGHIHNTLAEYSAAIFIVIFSVVSLVVAQLCASRNIQYAAFIDAHHSCIGNDELRAAVHNDVS